MSPDWLGDSDPAVEAAVHPHGVPLEWGWPCRTLRQAMLKPSKGGNRILPWWTAHEEASGNPATNSRVEVRSLWLRVLSAKTGRWCDGAAIPLFALSPGGFVPETTNGSPIPADFRLEADGGTSTRPGLQPDGTRKAAHGWTASMAAWPIADVAGLAITMMARVVRDDPKGADDRAAARFVAAIGADYWTAPGYVPGTNEGILIRRPQLLTPEWQTLALTTLSAEQLAAHPPPL